MDGMMSTATREGLDQATEKTSDLQVHANSSDVAYSSTLSRSGIWVVCAHYCLPTTDAVGHTLFQKQAPIAIPVSISTRIILEKPDTAVRRPIISFFRDVTIRDERS